jgi:hypothetical protein
LIEIEFEIVNEILIYIFYFLIFACREWLEEVFENETELVLKFVPSQNGIIGNIEDSQLDVQSVGAWNRTLVVSTLKAGQVTVKLVAQGQSQNYT